MKKSVFILSVSIFLFSSFVCLSYAGSVPSGINKKRALAVKPKAIVMNISNPSPYQYGINCEIKFRVVYGPSHEKYRTVWTQICSADKKSCGGAITTRYSKPCVITVKPDDTMAGKDWRLKVYTDDKRYVGYSLPFFVDGMLPVCK